MGKALRRLGALCAHHRYVVLVVWIGLIAVAITAVSTLGAKTNNNLSLPGTDSQAAFDLLEKEFPPQENGTNPFLFAVTDGKLTDARYSEAMKKSSAAIAADKYVDSSTDPISKEGQEAGFLSKDGKIGFNPVLLNINSGFITEQLAQDTLDATEPARKVGIQVAVGGSIGSVLSTPETKESELLGNISAMVILALVFGSLVAMGLPIITAAGALTVTVSTIGLLGHVFGIPSIAPTIATMIGLGVGIDYALFLITKHKEGLANGADIHDSIAESVATSGSAVVFAGGTVVIALLSLYVAGIPLVSALGLAAATAVFMAVLASITLLPAILSIVGHGVEHLKIPTFMRMKEREPGGRRWDAWARWVTGHPWIAIAIGLIILIPLALPLASLELGQEDIGVTPKDTTERQAYDLMTKGFGVGYNGPLLIASSLHPIAKPSAEYTEKYNEATALQKQLEEQQRQLLRQKDRLESQQRALEEESDALNAQAADLQKQATALERKAAILQRQKEHLLHEKDHIIRRAKPLVIQLGELLIAERVLIRRIDRATNPADAARLRGRLEIIRVRIAALEARLRPLVHETERLVAQAQDLARKAAALERQEQVLLHREAVLTSEGQDLQHQAAILERKSAALQRQANRTTREKGHAEQLKSELTRMLTKAGGDDRGTDPRLVKLQDALGDTNNVKLVSPPQINKAGSAATFSVIAKTSPSSDATANLVDVLRTTVLPQTNGQDGVTSYVGGTTASNVDLATQIAKRLPLVIMTVIGLSFLLLMVAFRSLLVPLQAAITNLLTVAAALGVLTAVFQWGWGLSAIGLDAPGNTVPIASYVPLMMFAVLFGLSMDYEVFTVSRIQQHHLEGEDARAAVTSGLGSAAHVVIAAATIMFLVFASFIINGDPTVKQFGVGLATAVALAGTMVVLFAPAMLTLFGRAMFWVPKWLGKILPKVEIE